MEKVEILSGKKRNKLIGYILTIALFTLLFSSFTNDSNATHLTGEIATKNDIIKSTIITLFVGLPMLGFFFGVFVNLFPYKKAKFSEKYLRSSLYTILVLESLFFIGTFIGSVREFFQ